MSLLSDFTAHHSSSEAWLYDRFIAPDMGETVVDDYLHLLPQGAEVLEMGCGGGQFARAQLDKRRDLRWTGLDVSTAQIARARQRCRFEDARSFVSRWRAHAITRPVNLALFRTLVAGRSLYLDDAVLISTFGEVT